MPKSGREIRPVTQGFAAAAGRRVVRSAQTAEAVEVVVRRIWIEFLRSASANASPAALKAALSRVFDRLDREVTQAVRERLARDLDGGRQDSAAVVAQAVPVEVKASAAVVKAGGGLQEQQRAGMTVDFELAPGQSQDEVDALLIPPLDADKTREILERPVNGESWQDRLSGLSKRIVDRDALVDSMARGLANGKTPKQLVDDVLPHVAGYGAAARRIARTESLRVQHEANQDMLDELGDEIIGYTREVTLDDVTGDDHRPLAGKFYPKGTEPRLPDRPNCILPGQVVSGQVVAVMRCRYAGQVVEVRTAAGRTLTVTPQHRVMTAQGFAAAGSLRQGQHLVCDLLDAKRPGAVQQDEHDQPPTIEQVFRALREAGGTTAVHGTLDLHGDEQSVEGEVEVVAVDGVLLRHGLAAGPQGIGQRGFAEADMQALRCPSVGPQHLAFRRINPPLTGRVRGGDLAGPAVAVHAGPFQPLGIGPSAELHARFAHAFGEDLPVDAAVVREMLERFPGEVSTDEVVEVRYRDYAGHVYDFHTVNSWTSVHSIINHNCRCWLAPVFADEPLVRAVDPVTGLPRVGVKQLDLADVDGTYNAGTYDQWFDRQPAEVQREIVGPTRWKAVAPAVAGSRAPKWSDFVRPDGSLESPGKLTGSTPQTLADRAERRRVALRNETAATLGAARAAGTRVAATTGPLAGNVQAVSRPFAGGDVPPDTAPPASTVSTPSGPQPKPYIPPTALPPPVPDRKALVAVLASDPDLDAITKKLAKAAAAEGARIKRTEAREQKAIDKAANEMDRLFVAGGPNESPAERAARIAEMDRLADEVSKALRRRRERQQDIEAERAKTLSAALGIPAEDRYNKTEFAGKAVTGLPVIRDCGKEVPTESATEKRHSKAMDLLRSMMRRSGVPSGLQADLQQIKGRAYYHPQDKAVRLDADDSLSVHVHEIAHAIEHQVPGVEKACQEFLEHRRNGQPLKKLSDAIPGHSDDNLAFDDDFAKVFGPHSAWYVGKQYDDGGTEVLSMGLQKLVEDPAGFLQKDPEYAKFVIGILTGHTRM